VSEKANTEEKALPEIKKHVLLGAITYDNFDHYQKFLEGLKPDQAILVLMAAVKHAYNKPGTYTMEETELVMKALRTISNAAKPQEQPTDENKSNDTTN